MFSRPAAAQDLSDERKAQVYGFVAAGVFHDTGEATIQAGGGAERRVVRGLGIGAAVGGLHANDWWASVFTLYTSYSWNVAGHARTIPHVFGGIVVAPTFQVPGGFNFGGGLTVWLRDRIGLRVAFRDDVFRGLASHHHDMMLIGVAARERPAGDKSTGEQTGARRGP